MPFRIKLLISSGPALCLLFKEVTMSVTSYLVVGEKKIELAFGCPRNLEICLSDGGIF